ncbi:hypothetical protein V1463_04085 [Micrococcus yunnanensis]|uniref:hypothetical protein n=1 Tax=Micrococcus yunnanensis TaxID=566027 RepID=UPI00300E347F
MEVVIPPGAAADEEALREAGGVDVQLLAAQTRRDDARVFDGDLELAGEYRHMGEAKPSWQGL